MRDPILSDHIWIETCGFGNLLQFVLQVDKATSELKNANVRLKETLTKVTKINCG